MRRAVPGLVILIVLLVMGIPLWVLGGYKEGQEPDPTGTESREPVVRVFNRSSGQVLVMELEKYLEGVVAAEMPADFEAEALKAQAVAARTYTVKRMFEYGAKPRDEHQGAEVCSDSAHCQAWLDEKELKERWGRLGYYLKRDKIRMAPKATKGQVLTWNNAFIDPVYHGACGGKGTENSEDVWAAGSPYLRGVECCSEYKAEEQVFRSQLDENKLTELLAQKGIKRQSLLGKGNFGDSVKKSSRGRLLEIEFAGQKISGTELRQLLGLPSTHISWEVGQEVVTFAASGKGHAVGLCQYGANGMALAGKTYRDILLHYYTGVNLQKLKY